MTIGQTGKRAQHFGQHRQSQYQLDYSQADNTPLNPPRRRTPKQEQPSIQRIATESSTQHSEVQRSSIQENHSAQAQPIVLETSVQRDDAVVEPPSSGDDLIQEVADRVFKLMLADVKKDRERSGGRFS